MAGGIYYVESEPRSPEHLAAYHHWYADVHVPEMLSIDGYVSAERFASVEDGGFITIYQIEDDVAAAKAALAARNASGSMTPPKGVQLKPPPVGRYFTELP